jgi:integrase/recombinase XerD
MLKVYRRHNPILCQHTERTWRRCSCPLWADGSLAGKRFHKTLKTRNWDTAQKIAQDLEASGKPPDERLTVKEVCDAYLRDAEGRGLKDSSLQKYRLLFRRLQTFATSKGLAFITELDIENLRTFRSGWKLKNFAARVSTENLRALMRFAHDSGWIPSNPGKLLKSPEVRSTPSVPFTDEEFTKILKACESYRSLKGVNIKAFVLLLRYSGLRIRDAVTLERSRLSNGKLFLATAKTGTVVHLPLHPDAVTALDAIPSNGTGFFFWTGDGKPKTRVANYQASLSKLFKLAGIEHGHAHRFRHTFAVSLLLKGVPIERVAVLLGHSGTKVTAAHYNPWIVARQEQLEDDVRRTWGSVSKAS